MDDMPAIPVRKRLLVGAAPAGNDHAPNAICGASSRRSECGRGGCFRGAGVRVPEQRRRWHAQATREMALLDAVAGASHAERQSVLKNALQ